MNEQERVARAIAELRGHKPDESLSKFGTDATPAWIFYTPDAEAAITAHLAALADAGMVVVPREPTEAMQHAGRQSLRVNGFYGTYKAMIAAAEDNDV